MNTQNIFKYIPVNEMVKNWGFYVSNIGHSITPPNSPYPPEKHPDDHDFQWQSGRVLDSFQIIYIPEGKGILETKESGEHEISNGDIFVLFPGVWHRYKPDKETGWREYWIEFGGEIANKLMDHPYFMVREPILRIGADEQIIDLVQQMLEVANLENADFEYVLSGLAVNFLTKIIADNGNQELHERNTYRIISRAKCVLLENLTNNVDLYELAEKHGVSYSWFRKAFKEYTGFSPRQYQLEHRLNAAKRMLASNSLSVSQISNDLGFDSVYYFSQFFKKKTSMSPKQYKNSRYPD